MKVCLRVKGERLLARVTAELARATSAFPRQFAPNIPLHWQIERLPTPLSIDDLRSTPGRVSVVLLEACDTQVIDELWSLTSRDYDAIANDRRDARQPMPVILVFERELPTSQLVELPAVVTDWVNGLDAMQDLARRVFAALRRQPQLATDMDGARLSLMAGSRRLCHADASMPLTPSEVAVAELFLSRFGSVIPLEEIQLLFKLAGRSTEGSNVRVSMFQLRFKIEALTHCQYTLSSAYGLGYVLRHGKAADAATPSQRAATRLQAASPFVTTSSKTLA